VDEIALLGFYPDRFRHQEELYMTKAAIVDIYCRTATDGLETPTKLEQQEAACRAYCNEHELSIGLVHHEVSSGSTYRDREQLGLMRTRYHDGTIQGIVVATLDRLSRSHVHLIILMQEMEAHNVVFYCVDENVEDSPTGKFISLVLGIITEIEREKTLDTLLAHPER
jgi:site-specific DNA recombinase